MNYQKLKERIQAAIERKPDDFAAYEDYFALCREYESVAFREAHAWNHAQRSLVSEALRRAALAEVRCATLFRRLFAGGGVRQAP